MLDIEKQFTYHPSNEDQQKRYRMINSLFKALAEDLTFYCPDSPELTLAIRKLQEARMWANASIAINES